MFHYIMSRFKLVTYNTFRIFQGPVTFEASDRIGITEIEQLGEGMYKQDRVVDAQYNV